MELELIQNKIYEIRGCKVMLDFDLAAMYQVETRVLNQSVKRNIKRFPPDFMFQLTEYEWENMSSQIVTTLPVKRPKSALPFAFTEQGVSMLSSVVRSEVAIEINISIMRAFVATRQFILNSPGNNSVSQDEFQELKKYLEEVFADYNDINEDTRMQLELINATLAGLQAKNLKTNQPRPQIGYTADRYKNREK